METAKQLSVSLVNKPSRLADMLGALQKHRVDFRALVVMDSGERGRVRFVPDNVDAAKAVLAELNLSYETTDVLLVQVPNQPGAFRRICEKLAAEHLNIDYAYCSFSVLGNAKGMLAVIRVNDLAKAQRVLSENGGARSRTANKRPGRRPVHAR